MQTYLLDADHGSALLKRGHPLRQRIESAARGGDRFVLPATVLEEIQFGVAATRDPVLRTRREQALDRLLELAPVVALTSSTAREAGRLRASCAAPGGSFRL